MTKAKPKEVKLPTLLSDCITLALTDLEKVEKSRKYTVNMSVFHEPSGGEWHDKKCSVCFAGSVIANTLGADISKSLEPADFNKHNENRLYALDSLRMGWIDTAFEYLGKKKPEILSNKAFPVVAYSQSPVQFKKDMANLAALLKATGN